jgi:hypothetical protein
MGLFHCYQIPWRKLNFGKIENFKTKILRLFEVSGRGYNIELRILLFRKR